jgi:hypothetical protein
LKKGQEAIQYKFQKGYPVDGQIGLGFVQGHFLVEERGTGGHGLGSWVGVRIPDLNRVFGPPIFYQVRKIVVIISVNRQQRTGGTTGNVRPTRWWEFGFPKGKGH